MKKLALLACLTVTTLGVSAAAQAAPAKKATAAPAAAHDWSRTVIKTAEGGFQIGNPAAKVKLVEYGSMTCSHCAHFDETGYKPLIANYVRTGKVAFEFRNYVRDPYDLAAALTARCGGTTRFFALTNGLFATRETWIGKIQAGQEKLKAYEGKQPVEFLPAVGSLAGFDAFAAARGVPVAKVKACLANKAEIDRLIAMHNKASFVEGTPTFLLNGKPLTITVDRESWDQVEDALKAAL
ncbi:DsbA family protein [Sphingomonas jaspsi]|uniref:DsbA family protein n=1 Tax=Sphingomonas jaspsi TaxID=392409 RepID=UPI0004BAF023|nr:thioredoxin domain-containing protein [Sphingomonas jaspsi]